VLAISCVAFILFPKKESPYPRETFILVGSPMTVFSWNPRDRNITLITIPEDVTAEGTHGYGTYTLEAFWRLGQIDKKDGTVLAESMSEALGIPVTGYMGYKNGPIRQTVFSFKNIFAYLRGEYLTNIPFGTFLRFVWLMQVTKPARVTTFDFTRTPGFIADDVLIADGTHQLVMSSDRMDARLAHVFEDELVRRESVTTTVYNTTTMLSLGNRVARLLQNVGVSILSVGNDSPEVDRCVVSGTKEFLKSKSAGAIESALGCTEHEILVSDRADLTVRIGKSYAKRFLPN
jgi:hypothetical protein